MLTPAPSARATPERGASVPKTPKKRSKKRVTRHLTPASQPVSPSASEISGIESALAPSRDATPPPRPRKAKWGERKSALSKEYIDDSEDEVVPTSPTRRIPASDQPEGVDEDEDADEAEEEYDDDDVALERAALEEEGDSGDESGARGEGESGIEGESESGSEGESEVDAESDDELPAYPPTEPIKPPPSTMPLVAMSQVSDLPDIPVREERKRQRRMNDTEYETFLRTKVTSEDAAQDVLASRWLSPDDIRRLEATGREFASS